MKIKENFVLREVAGTWVVLPLGEAAMDATGMLTLNETGAALWKVLENGCDMPALVAYMTSEYGISEDIAKADAEEFVQKLTAAGYLISE